MQHKYLAFDLEIVKEFPDGSDWTDYRPLGISCAATFSSDDSQPRLWHGAPSDAEPGDSMSREEAAGLVDFLETSVDAGFTLLSWNGLGFDFQVLAEESDRLDTCRRLAREHVDMMFHFFCLQGYPVSLDATARGMGLSGKLAGMSGIEAPRRWASGNRREVLDYVSEDARLTLELATVCEQERKLSWITRRGAKKKIPLPHGWLPVTTAIKVPRPDTSWMTTPTPRRKFTTWLD